MAKRLSSRAQRAWKRLGEWYGARLAESYGATCPDDWAIVIDRTDDERLEQALSAIRREHIKHPPTLPELEAAIPRKSIGDQGPTAASILAAHAVSTLSLCAHQLRGPWNYFGPETEYPARGKVRENPIRNPDPRGVVISACGACERPSHRVLLKDIVGRGVAA